MVPLGRGVLRSPQGVLISFPKTQSHSASSSLPLDVGFLSGRVCSPGIRRAIPSNATQPTHSAGWGGSQGGHARGQSQSLQQWAVLLWRSASAALKGNMSPSGQEGSLSLSLGLPTFRKCHLHGRPRSHLLCPLLPTANPLPSPGHSSKPQP